MVMFFLLTINPKGEVMHTSTNKHLIIFDKAIRIGCFGLFIVLFFSFSITGQNLAQTEINTDYHFPLSWFAQETEESVYMKKIDVSINEMKLAEAFEEIASLGNIRLTYNEKQLPDETVSLNLYDVTIIEAFYALLEGTGFEVLGSSRGQVVFKTQEEMADFEEDNFTVTGTVRDSETGETMPGVNIAIEGTTIGTATDQDGQYSLDIPDESAILIFSYVGYGTQQIEVDGQNVINVSMEQDLGRMDEMVVIGYSAVKKSSLTAAISKIENETLDQMPVGRPESALVGRMAGVNIAQTRSRPGDGPTITIRGPGSISASNDPLIVIDGFPGGSFDDINMNDVESVEVLKDASSAAIYGSRGSGGVIIVTTRQGRTGDEPRFSLNSYYGIATPMVHGVDAWIPGGQEFFEYTARYVNRDFFYQGGDTSLPLNSPDRPAQYRVGAAEEALSAGNYNWEDIIMTSAPIQNYNLSVAGGTDNTNYYLSGTYRTEDGTVPNTWADQYAVRANFNVNVSERLRAGIMLNPSYNQRRLYGGGLQNQIKMPPFLSPERQEDGSYLKPLDYWGTTVSAGVNPLAHFEGNHIYQNRFNNNGEMFFSAILLENLEFRTSVGANVTFINNENFTEARGTALNRPAGSEFRGRTINLINENILNYQTTFSQVHNFAGLLGASFQHSGTWNANMAAIPGEFANETIRTLNNAIINPGPTSSTKTQWGLASYFARVNYDYDERYLFSASFRTDGSSRFGPNNRWGYFPSASAAWRISQERFMDDFQSISELKIRASYGVTGNFNIGDFGYLGTIGDAVYAPDGQLRVGQAQQSFGNPELKWERTRSYDIGLDISLFDHRLSFVIDYYDKTTMDLLYNVSTPATTGFTNSLTNIGDINNRGFELEVSTINVNRSDFFWTPSFNYTLNRNKVVRLGGGVDEVINTHFRGMGWILREGEPMFSYYGHQQIGVIQTEQQLNDVATMPGQPVGTVMMKDLNGDGVIDAADREILGNFMPDYTFGFVNEVNWRNFDLSIVMQASLGGKMYNLENLFYQGATVSAFLRPITEGQWWSVDEPGDGHHPAASLAAQNFVGPSSYFLEDASFLAVRNINFGYSMPSSVLQPLGVRDLRLYMSVSNPFMFTRSDFHGYNPEGYTTAGISGIGSMPGLNAGSEPINRTIAFGINMNF